MESGDTAAQRAYIDQLAAKAHADGRALAAWLEGSFGRGNDDRYSDVDLHLLLDEGEVASFRAVAEGWLVSVQPLVLYTLCGRAGATGDSSPSSAASPIPPSSRLQLSRICGASWSPWVIGALWPICSARPRRESTAR